MNWRAVGAEIAILGLVAAGPVLTYEQQSHPQWTWIGFAMSLVGYMTSRFMPSPKQQKVIELQRKELDSLRPPKGDA